MPVKELFTLAMYAKVWSEFFRGFFFSNNLHVDIDICFPIHYNYLDAIFTKEATWLTGESLGLSLFLHIPSHVN